MLTGLCILTSIVSVQAGEVAALPDDCRGAAFTACRSCAEDEYDDGTACAACPTGSVSKAYETNDFYGCIECPSGQGLAASTSSFDYAFNKDDCVTCSGGFPLKGVCQSCHGGWLPSTTGATVDDTTARYMAPMTPDAGAASAADCSCLTGWTKETCIGTVTGVNSFSADGGTCNQDADASTTYHRCTCTGTDAECPPLPPITGEACTLVKSACERTFESLPTQTLCAKKNGAMSQCGSSWGNCLETCTAASGGIAACATKEMFDTCSEGGDESFAAAATVLLIPILRALQ